MGPRPARCECRSRHEAAAGSRNPSCRASAFCTSNINDLQWFVKSKATFAGKPSQSSLRDASSPEGGAFRPLRHGLRRATSPKGRGKKRSRHALGSPLGRAAERNEAERAWPLKTARAQNLSQKRFRFVEISSPEGGAFRPLRHGLRRATLFPFLSLTRHLPPTGGSLSKGEARSAPVMPLALPLGELLSEAKLRGRGR